MLNNVLTVTLMTELQSKRKPGRIYGLKNKNQFVMHGDCDLMTRKNIYKYLCHSIGNTMPF